MLTCFTLGLECLTFPFIHRRPKCLLYPWIVFVFVDILVLFFFLLCVSLLCKWNESPTPPFQAGRARPLEHSNISNIWPSINFDYIFWDQLDLDNCSRNRTDWIFNSRLLERSGSWYLEFLSSLKSLNQRRQGNLIKGNLIIFAPFPFSAAPNTHPFATALGARAQVWSDSHLGRWSRDLFLEHPTI